ncbi:MULTISPECIES: outer membrane protein [unclassified Salinivibrio]|uniref:outer membrane protein n=1 Tax=unclassified Salinivibrio TaxID=2636825 RepID=UPI0009865561|nr:MULTISPECIES: outer membrane beta-barrel protein [unclassified Salinivibrio]OOF13049.1 hypothetical protein BZG83_09855 [Salinivibrio sp. PR919]OOF18519.1 hypothetical protein BZG84_03495 [Salinivibrio sp. PR932]
MKMKYLSLALFSLFIAPATWADMTKTQQEQVIQALKTMPQKATTPSPLSINDDDYHFTSTWHWDIESSLYVGGELGYIRFGSDTSSDTAKQRANDIDDGGMATLKVGSYFGQNLRVYGYLQRNIETEVSYSLSLNNENLSAELSREGYQYGVGADYLYHFMPKNYLSIGARIGHYDNEIQYSASAMGETLKGRTKTDGLATGISAGIGHEFTDHFSLELGYRYEKLEKDDNVLLGQRITFEDTHQAFLGLNYTF